MTTGPRLGERTAGREVLIADPLKEHLEGDAVVKVFPPQAHMSKRCMMIDWSGFWFECLIGHNYGSSFDSRLWRHRLRALTCYFSLSPIRLRTSPRSESGLPWYLSGKPQKKAYRQHKPVCSQPRWTEFFVTMFPAHQAQHERR
jgi:hypothetical protein